MAKSLEPLVSARRLHFFSTSSQFSLAISFIPKSLHPLNSLRSVDSFLFCFSQSCSAGSCLEMKYLDSDPLRIMMF
ncbi:hypothetical protein VIGAN_05113400 [Vigna angularis var. angularis]|uniref:Uncharacterized protein n=1 Tax=Vigna angularis var. angularis TaxID=157739 RepID=A0A0S3S4H6_PHAAN|nr:hypothetical protein VIGAN_05113400 [Vigna angularis var. angularis]